METYGRNIGPSHCCRDLADSGAGIPGLASRPAAESVCYGLQGLVVARVD